MASTRRSRSRRRGAFDRTWQHGGVDDTTVFIICRDRLGSLQRLVDWLETAGHERLILIDVQSTYVPLLEYLADSRHRVIRLNENVGHLAPWRSGIVQQYAPTEPYVVTDCDVVPDEECPHDAVAYLRDRLLKEPSLLKIGLSLRIDDLPDRYPQAAHVRAFEARFWQRMHSPGLWAADVDTTFAVYRPARPFDTHPAARTDKPYQARHLPWYLLPEAMPEDEAAYLANARLGDTTRNLAALPDWLERELQGRPPRRVPSRIEAKIRHVARTRRWR